MIYDDGSTKIWYGQIKTEFNTHAIYKRYGFFVFFTDVMVFRVRSPTAVARNAKRLIVLAILSSLAENINGSCATQWDRSWRKIYRESAVAFLFLFFFSLAIMIVRDVGNCVASCCWSITITRELFSVVFFLFIVMNKIFFWKFFRDLKWLCRLICV